MFIKIDKKIILKFKQCLQNSKIPKIPNVGVGNLSVGGTGKSVVIDYLISIFKEQYSLAVISRGYKRKTKGYIYEVREYAKNMAKWEAGTEFCKDRSWKFQVLTEKELGIKK